MPSAEHPAARDQVIGSLREIADYVVERDDTATAANALRTAADEIERLREQVNSGRTARERAEGLPEGTLPRV